MNLNHLEKLFIHELKDLYSAENQLIEALPSMIEAAGDADLQEALSSHLAETRSHAQRIEQIFRTLDFEPGGHHCKGMEGLLAEAKSALRDVPSDQQDVKDALIVAGAQRVEHYEIAGYGVARAYAKQLGNHQAAELLTKSLEEEGQADRRLTQLAERRINFLAMKAS